MAALHTRATATADALGLRADLLRRLATSAGIEAELRVLGYRGYPRDDLDTEWRHHAKPAIAADVHRSLHTLPAPNGGTDPSTGQNLPTPDAVIHHARRALDTAPPPPGTDIDAAIAAALPDTDPTASPDWDHHDPQPQPTRHAAPGAYHGPQP